MTLQVVLVPGLGLDDRSSTALRVLLDRVSVQPLPGFGRPAPRGPWSARALALFTDGAVVTVPGGGHMVPMTRPAEVAEAVRTVSRSST